MTRDGDGSTTARRLSLDGWAVLLAFLLAVAVRFGILSKVPW